MVVEDEQRIASFIQRGLTEQGHAVDIAYDGEEGLYLAEVHDYDVLLLDILLPKKSGFEVCEELRRRHNSTPILMLTARGAISDRIRGLDSGADDCLVAGSVATIALLKGRAGPAWLDGLGVSCLWVDVDGRRGGSFPAAV